MDRQVGQTSRLKFTRWTNATPTPSSSVRGSSLNYEKSGAIKGCGQTLSVLVFGVFFKRIQRIY